MPAPPQLLSLPMTGAYFRLIMRRFGGERRGRAALLADTGCAGDDAEIPVRGQLQQLANLQRIAPPDWGLELGALLDVITHGPSGLVAVSAPTVAAALDTLTRYLTVRTPFVDVRLVRERGRVRVRIVEPCRLGSVRTPLLEMVLLSLQSTIEASLGFAMTDAAFVMPAGRPAYWRRYDQRFHAPVTFAGNAAGVSVPEEWLSLPCPLADPIAHRNTLARLESARQRPGADRIDAAIERLLAAGDDAGPSLRQAAAALRLSQRTLVRRLARRRTSYRTLLDAHRRRRGAELLEQAELSVADIAERLGYADPTNFARACRRWFNASPRAVRKRGAPD